jgi:4-amino-4-deoxy-L-arabinose transferase-like glycosyltransferase
LVFLLAVAIRVGYLADIHTHPTFGYYSMDPAYHREWATEIVAGDDHAGPFYRAPLYPYFLALVYAVFGTGPWPILLIQAILGSASCVLTFVITRRFAGHRNGLIAGVLMALYWPAVYFGGLLLVETLAVFLYLWLLAVLARSPASSRGRAAWLFAGTLLGAGAICRPSILVFLPIPVLGLWLDPRRDPSRRRLSALGAYFLGVALPILPVTLHNVVAGKDLVLIAWSDGINLYIGNNPAADGASAIAPGMRADWWGGYHDAYRLAEEEAGRSLAPSEVSGHWRAKALRFVVEHPKRAAALFARKAAYLVSAIERSNNYPIHYFRSQSPFLRWPWVGYGLVFPLAVYGAWRERRRWRELHLLYGFLLTYAIAIVIFFVNARFRLPIVPILIVFAAAGIGRALSALRRRDPREVSVVVALIGLGVAGSQGLGRGFARDLQEAHGHLIDGDAYLERGEARRAVAELERAVERFPELPGACGSLGRAFLALGDTSRARRAYELDLKRAEPDARTLFSLAELAAASGDTTAAFRLYGRALAAHPIPRDASDVHYNLGNLHLARRCDDAAALSYRDALRWNPRNAPALNNLASIHLAQRTPAEAESLLRRAMDVDADYAGARLNLSMALSMQGRFEEALDAAERALQLDPTSGVARRLVLILQDAVADYRRESPSPARQPPKGRSGEQP